MQEKTGRNAPCPCGSGRKYKQCCLGRSADAPAPPIDLAPGLFAEANHRQQRGDLAGALRCIDATLALRPSYVEAHVNRGNVLHDLRRFDDAAASYRTALKLRPGFSELGLNLGLSLHAAGRFDEAIAAYEAARSTLGEHVHLLQNLGLAQRDAGRPDEALATLEGALRANPQAQAEAPALHQAVAETLRSQGRYAEAEARIRVALALAPGAADLWRSLAGTLMDQDRMAEAAASYREALARDPGHLETHSNLIFCLNYTASDARERFEAALRFGQSAAARVPAPPASWQPRAPGAPLRVGLVSGDLGEHPVGYFLESVLGQIDPARVELSAYLTRPRDDALSRRFRPRFARWIALWEFDDTRAARQIHDDGIHVLLDLAGHTAHNRLALFARRPAPVQASWLGYFATTGLPEMDYLIADAHSVPPDSPERFTESVWRLPETRLCFTPPAVDIAVAPLPARAAGAITFACLSTLAKVNPAVLALWSRVLDAVPGSRLLLQAAALRTGPGRNAVLERLAAAGIDRDRVQLEGAVPRAQYLATYHRADIVLETFPFTGGTTTAEALWMGVPVLTLAGDRLVSRQGVSLLANAGLADWIAHDGDDYVQRARGFAADLDALEALRRKLRAQVLASPLFDAPRFAGYLQDALEGMWRREEAGA